MKFNRKNLIEIRSAATTEAEIQGTNPTWVRAYLRLADAADHLDAMKARTSTPQDSADWWKNQK